MEKQSDVGLRRLKEVCLINGLKRKISDASLLYGESSKSARNWQSFGKVDLETQKNVLWSRWVTLVPQGGSLEPNKLTSVGAEHVCFGENHGYWQLYFCLDGGKSYKLKGGGCKMTLNSQCHEGKLTIELKEAGKKEDGGAAEMRVKFQISSLGVEFKVTEGELTTRGCKVWIRNLMDTEVEITCAIITETHPSDSAGARAARWRGKFKSNILESDGAIVSEELYLYNCFNRKHFLRLCFTSGGHCHELDAPLNLTEEDYGGSVDVDIIGRPSGKSTSIRIRSNKSEKSYDISVKQTVDEVKARIVEKFRKARSHDYEDAAVKLIGKLTELSPGEDNHKRWLIVERTYSDFVFSSKDCLLLTKPREAELIRHFEDVKNCWGKVRELISSTELLLETINPSGDSETDRISEEVRTIRSMLITDVICQILEPSGLDDHGWLMFRMSAHEQAVGMPLPPGELAEALKQELDLWKMTGLSLQEEGVRGNEELKKLIIYQNTYCRLNEISNHVGRELVSNLKKIASELHLQSRNVSISMLTSSSLGVVGAGLTVAGLIAAPFTSGISLILVGSGLGVGITSGALGVGTAIVDGILTGRYLWLTVSLAESDLHIREAMAELWSNIEMQNEVVQLQKTSWNQDGLEDHFKVTNVALSMTNTISNVGVMVVKAGVQVAKTATLRAGSVVIGLIFDLTSLVIRAMGLARGARSELGFKLESDALLLKMDMMERNYLYRQAVEKGKSGDVDLEKIQSFVKKFL